MLNEVVIILALILANGVFAAAEMAVVAARKARLQTMLEDGDQAAGRVLKLQANPGEFLATVQIGITVVGTLASVVGGAGVVDALTPGLATLPYIGSYAETIALGLVVVGISYLSLVFGELVPKRLALQNAEGTAISLSGILDILARVAYLPMRLLAFSAELVTRVLGKDESNGPTTSPEEIEMMVKQGAAEGVIDQVEEELIKAVFDYTDLRAWDIMTPRTDIVAFNVQSDPKAALGVARQHGFSRYPVFEETLDNISGYVHVKDLIWAEEAQNLRDYVREVVFIPGNTTLPNAFSHLSGVGRHIAIILDEFGGTDGMLTLEDLLEEIVGEIEDEHSPVAEPAPQTTHEGKWTLSGGLPINEAEEVLQLDFPDRDEYSTLAGYLLYEMGFIPQEGQALERLGYRFIVTEMDRLRIETIQVEKIDSV